MSVSKGDLRLMVMVGIGLVVWLLFTRLEIVESVISNRMICRRLDSQWSPSMMAIGMTLTVLQFGHCEARTAVRLFANKTDSTAAHRIDTCSYCLEKCLFNHHNENKRDRSLN